MPPTGTPSQRDSTTFRTLLLALVCVLLGGGTAFLLLRMRHPKDLDPNLVAVRVQDVSRLEALEVLLYRKVSFEPDPEPAGSLWGDVWSWARHTLRQPQGRAIVFARAHLSYDLSHLHAGQLQLTPKHADLYLPPMQVTLELLPGETEVIGSNLDSQETAQLMALAKSAFERQVASDPLLRARAEASARHTLEALLFHLGVPQVEVHGPNS